MIPVDLPAIEHSLAVYATEVCEAESARVTWLGVDPEIVRGLYHWEGDPCRSKPTLRLVTEDSRLTVHPKLDIAVPVLVATAAVSAGDPVTWTEGTALLAQVVGDPVSEGEWVARIRLDKGDALTGAVVQAPMDAHSGADVTLLLSRGVLRVSARGRLLTDGRLGDPVRVTNLATGSPMNGTLVAPNTVEIR